MRITGITTKVIEIDPAPRYKDGVVPAGRPRVWRFPLLTVHTDEGIDGYSTGFGPHGDGLAIVESLHAIYAPELIGSNPMASEELWQRIWRKHRHLYHQRDSLLGVVDVAVWDIKGKALGAPIADLLGRYRDRMPCYATARSEHYTAQEIFDEVKVVQGEGYHGYKVQLRDGIEQDIPRLRAAREAAGDGFKLMDDPAAGYDLSQALTVGRVLDELDYYWYEEPIPDHNYTGLEQLARHLKTPLLLGETVRLSELPVYLRGAMSPLVRGDTLLKGGITGLHKAMATAELFGIGLEIHTTDSPLLDIANLQVGCAASNSEFMEIDHAIFRWGVRDNPMHPDADGMVYLPAGAGLGVELDLDWIDDHTAATRTTTG